MTDRRHPNLDEPEQDEPTPEEQPQAAAEQMEAAVAADSLELALGRLRRRAWKIEGGAAALLFVAAALAVIALASAAAALGAGGWLRPLTVTLLLALAAAALIRVSRRAGSLGPVELARTLEERDPRAAGLTTAVELAASLREDAPGSSAKASYSKELAWAHVSVAAGRAIWVGPEQAFPALPLRRAAAAAGASAVMVAALGVFAPPFAAGLRLVALGPDEAAPPAPRAAPITGDIALTYVYPRYTGLPPKVVEGTNGEINALRGTEVRIETRADREVSRAFLELGGAARPLEVEGGRQLRGSLQVQGDGSYSFRFEGMAGRTLAVGPPIPIVSISDQAPTISIDAPVPELVLTERDSVELVFDASDDFGIAAVELVFRIAGGEEQRLPIASYGEPRARIGGTHVWELSTLGARPGDTVSYYLRAKDNDEVSGAKWGQSRTQEIKIFSEAEHRRELIAKIEEAWEEMIVALGQRITPRMGPRKVEDAQRLQAGEAADGKVRTVTTTLQDVAAELGEDERAPQELLAAVRNLSAALAAKSATTRDRRARGKLLSPQGRISFVPQLDRAEADEQRELEQGILYLEAMLDRQRLREIEELAQELAADRRELANLLEQYRDAPSDEARDAIRQELSRLKARMAEMMRRMHRLGKGLQDEHLNAEAMQALAKERDMISQLDEVERLLSEGKTDEALAELQKLGMQMDEMAQALADASEGQAENDPTLRQLAEDMGAYERELDELTRDQQRLVEATQKLRSEQSEAIRERLSKGGDALLEELQEKIALAQDHLGRIPDGRIPSYAVDDRGGAAERLDDLENALKGGDFDAAQESAARALAHAQALVRELEGEASRLSRFSPDEARRIRGLGGEAQPAAKLVHEVKEKLDQLLSQPSQGMSPQQQARAERLAERQRELGQMMQQLQERADKVGEQAPIFDQEAQQSMAGAQRSMAEAEGKLRGQDPGGALASERSALEQLQTLKRGLEEARERAQQGGGGGGQGFPMPMASGMGRGKGGKGRGSFDGKEKVAIPNADQHKAPEEYRKEILDAMKQGSPKGFQENVREYYQEIVK